MRWFRFYDDTLNNPKVQRLSGDLYKAWGNLLCLANKNGGNLPPIADIGFALRVAEQKAQGWVAALIKAELFDQTSDGIRPHDWDEWQYASDSAAERMRRHRQRKRDSASDVGVTSHAPSPVPNSDGTEQKQNRTDSEQNAADANARARDPRFGQVYAGLETLLNNSAFNGSRIHAWLAAGADPELDIFPTVKRLLARKNGQAPPSSLKYFDHAIADAMAARLSPMPQGTSQKTAKKDRTDAIRNVFDQFDDFCNRNEGEDQRDRPGYARALPSPDSS